MAKVEGSNPFIRFFVSRVIQGFCLGDFEDSQLRGR